MRDSPTPDRVTPDEDALTRRERLAVGVLLAFTLVALAGFGVFGRNPALLGRLPAGLAGFYGMAFGFFAQAHIVLAAVVLLWVLVGRVGWRWPAVFAAVYALSLGSELAGTRFGVPFGGYSYGEQLGPRWFGLVPVLIPVSWFVMAIPSYGLAGRVAGGAGAVARVVVASLILLIWDLSLDPAMSLVTRYWSWADPGPYYGMPLVNLFGWFVTGIVLMATMFALRTHDWLDEVPAVFLVVFWSVNLLLPLGMNAVAGLTGAVLAGVMGVVLLGWLVLGRRSGGTRPSVSARSEGRLTRVGQGRVG